VQLPLHRLPLDIAGFRAKFDRQPLQRLVESADGLLLVDRKAADILGRSAATLKRWRCEGVGPDWIEIEGRVSYDVAVLLEFIRKSTRVASVRAALEGTREAV
jgi:hypothetical protein